MVASAKRMATPKHKILVLFGNGAVGKSTLSAQQAFALAARDFEVGLHDIDISHLWSKHAKDAWPGQEMHPSNHEWSPVYLKSNLASFNRANASSSKYRCTVQQQTNTCTIAESLLEGTISFSKRMEVIRIIF